MPGFYHPLWLLGLLSIPVLIWYYRNSNRKIKKNALEFSQISYLKSALNDRRVSSPRHVQFGLILLAVGMIFVGLAGPHIPLEKVQDGANVVLALDVSGSMQATDYQPNRLESAKHAAAILLNQLDEMDYAGIVTFEAGASSAAYLSPDKERVIEKLALVQPRTGSTAIGDGLALAIDMAVSIPNRKSVVILLSDGENNAGYVSPEEAKEFARERNVQVFTVGLGSEEPVLVDYDLFGNPQYAHLDEETLQDISVETGGKYFRSVDDRTLEQIYRSLNAGIVREKEETNIQEFFFAVAAAVLIVQCLLRYGGRRITP
jgi:Ca-activated chloride channel family protein